ncbi:hypothetical protein [Streptomyces sp. KL116D]|uniref:hypothetical protein n=1 Tax=Streptomyces sp. KL116D TaxID=3045152 RepID=UPI0035586C70
MTDSEFGTHFDGRGRVEILPGLVTAAERQRIEETGHAFGYRLAAADSLGRRGVRLLFERDDGPVARRRAELTVARLRAGGPLLPVVDAPPPPPPPPPPVAPPPPARPPRPGHGPR